MQYLPDRSTSVSGEDGLSACPFHGSFGPGSRYGFDDWLETDLRCSAGRREFQLGRYLVATVRNGYQFAEALDGFRADAARHLKTGYMAIVATSRRFADSTEELHHLGQIIVDAGFAESAGALIRSQTVAIPIELDCPVTGLPTLYEFFPVAFCCHAGNVQDPLYDPALATPFLAINTTSDAFAFGMLARDLSLRLFQRPPYEIRRREDFDSLLARCVSAWQNMSVNTIQSYNKVAARPDRAVSLSRDQLSWFAPHSDPVFAEMAKQMHSHEMPIIYAKRLAATWSAAIFEGAGTAPRRDGQSGGIPAFDTRAAASR